MDGEVTGFVRVSRSRSHHGARGGAPGGPGTQARVPISVGARGDTGRDRKYKWDLCVKLQSEKKYNIDRSLAGGVRPTSPWRRASVCDAGPATGRRRVRRAYLVHVSTPDYFAAEMEAFAPRNAQVAQQDGFGALW